MRVILEVLNENGEVESSKEYKNLKLVTSDYPHIEYHQWRSVYLHYAGKTKKFIHPLTQQLINKFRIRPNLVV
jgi:hypothetical protein